MSTISASTTSTTGFKVTSDTTGTLVFQTGASPTTAMSISSSQIISFTNPPTATGGGSVSSNTAYGTSALFSNTTGDNNTGIGNEASYSNSTGVNNVAVGSLALRANTASQNVAVGVAAMYANTSGTQNVSIGSAANYASMRYNTTGSYNVAVGAGALAFNTIASYNVAVGTQALYSYSRTADSTGRNTGVGYQALYNLTTGQENVAIGPYAGYSNSIGINNIYIGEETGFYSTGSGNCFVGYNAGGTITTGSNNTIIGRYNGNSGGFDIRTSSNFIVLSDGAGNPAGVYLVSSGAWQHIINSNSGATYSQLSFSIANVLKSAIYWDNTNSRLQTYTNTTGPYVSNGSGSWTNSSDERLKNITGEIQNGLAKVCTLRAAEYTWKDDEEAKPKVGLIAQDVLAVLPEAVDVPEEGSLDKNGNPSMMGVAYTEVIPLLVAAIKELKAEIDTLKGQA